MPEREVEWFEGRKVWLEIDERLVTALLPGSPLLAAEREFEIAFANGGYDPGSGEHGLRSGLVRGIDGVAGGYARIGLGRR